MVVLSHIIGHESLQPLSWISLITSSAYSKNGNCPLHKESDWKEAGYYDHGINSFILVYYQASIWCKYV
ncbi:hypothetical protein Prudu_1487S001800 [Prunus dulcis]|uniref:Uncharacterized protein n=1 Tax=Prunus dulcis TaxID=3755 RepID=A0A5H2Y5P3_PRUDU|nr:hypothetical protein Prudu_1487S001800 [Prunus dulcis]